MGTTFKPNSDDVRDSPVLEVASQIYNAGADVHVYDPQGKKNSASFS
ncbi:UDP binding domain-containing protein [Glutamicibacter uratoxydans]